MTSNTRLRAAFSQLDTTKKDKDYLIPAVLGFMIQGKETVEVANRSGYVYARMRSNTNELIQAYNDKVSPVYDLPVLLQRDPTNPTRYRVEGRDVGRYSDWGSVSSYFPKHGNQHSFNIAGGGGGDITWVYSQQIVPWLVAPSGSNGGAGVIIHGHPHFANGQWVYWGGTGTSSILTYKPTDNQAKMVLISLDEIGNPLLSVGSPFSALYTGTNSILPYIPQSTGTPLAAVRLVSGTSSIMWPNIYDVRPFFSGGGGTSSSAGHMIRSNGANQTPRPNLNFEGSLFSVYDDPVNNSTNVSGTVGNADTVDNLHAAQLAGGYIRVWDNSAGVVKAFTPDAEGLCGAFTGLDALDVVQFPDKTISMSSGLYLPDYVYLTGMDPFKSLLYFGTAGASLVMGGSNCSIQNMYIYAIGSNSSGTIVAVDAGFAFNFISNSFLYAYNSSSSGTSLAINNAARTTCYNVILGAERTIGYVTPYDSRPRGVFSVKPTASTHKTIFDAARFGDESNYIELSTTGLFSSGTTARVHIKYSGYNSSNPPSIADLNVAFGSAAIVGTGFVGLLNDNGGGTNEYLCTSDGANWFYVTLTAAA